MDIGFYKAYFNIEKTHWLMRVRRLIIKDTLKSLRLNSKPGVKILDYGSGSGFLVKELQDEGLDVWGVDSSEQAVQYGKLQGVKNLSVIDNNYKWEVGSFNVLLMMDVLEHIKDPQTVLFPALESLEDGGYLIVTVPAYMFLWGVQDEIAHHYRRYTKTSLLTEILKNKNITVVHCTYFNSFLLIPIAGFRLFCRVFGFKNRQSDFDVNNRLLNYLFYLVFNLERKILKYIDFPAGVSILLVVRKSK